MFLTVFLNSRGRQNLEGRCLQRQEAASGSRKRLPSKPSQPSLTRIVRLSMKRSVPLAKMNH